MSQLGEWGKNNIGIYFLQKKTISGVDPRRYYEGRFSSAIKNLSIGEN